MKKKIRVNPMQIAEAVAWQLQTNQAFKEVICAQPLSARAYRKSSIIAMMVPLAIFI